MLSVYNTLTKEKEDFVPLGTRVNLFVCGPTVYGPSHIGHARTYIAFDTIVKYLRSQGQDVFYLQNITDIDDKIIHRAQESGIDPLELSKRETERYFSDMKSIGIDAVSEYVPTSKEDIIAGIISQIERLIEKGHAYPAGGSVYYDISTFPHFGKLSRQNLEALQKAARTEDDPNKKNAHDFVLWRGREENSGEPTWKSPWGPGRPGWHIEDTAITEKYFGPQYDIHGGGIELIFPHHEAEIAQMEGISGQTPLAQYWLHTGWVTVKGEKMSKSLGNFITIADILKKHSPEALRLLLLQTHYRSPLEYSGELVQAAENAVGRIRQLQARLRLAEGKNAPPSPLAVADEAENVKARISEAMNDDFSTSLALAHFFAFLDYIESGLRSKTIDDAGIQAAFDFFKFIKSVFGIIPSESPVPSEIQSKAQEREKLRQEKKWAESDVIRDEILAAGYAIDDTPDGPVVLPKSIRD